MEKYRIIMDGKVYEMEIERIDSQEDAPARKAEAVVKAPMGSTVSSKTNMVERAVKSPMPGTIVQVNAAVGDVVAKGQSIIVLEAMKMENEIVSPEDGKIAQIYVSKGDTVQGGAVLFEIGK